MLAQYATADDLPSLYTTKVDYSQKGYNQYAASVLNPARPAVIPDPENFTASFPKALSLSEDLAVQGSQTFALIFSEKRMEPRINVHVLSATGNWGYLMTIPFDQTLYQNYIKARVVSASMACVSSTVTGNNFTVAGSAIAINYQDSPAFYNPRSNENLVGFNNLLAYARNPACRQPMCSVAKGIITLAVPEGLNDYTALGPNNLAGDGVRSIPTVIQGSDKRVLRTAAYSGIINNGNGWLTAQTPIAANPAVTRLFDSANSNFPDGNFIPRNAAGAVRVRVNTNIIQTANNASIAYALYAVVAIVDPVTWAYDLPRYRLGLSTGVGLTTEARSRTTASTLLRTMTSATGQSSRST